MITDHAPTGTKLFNLPVLLENSTKAKMLIYTNLLKVKDDEHDEALMIVPFPNINQKNTTFGLVDITTEDMMTFRHLIETNCKLQSLGGTRLYKGPTKHQVHRIGNYDISVAPSLESLERNTNWHHFKLPSNFEERKKTFRNLQLYPWNCGYVVAKAWQSIADDGFGLVYPDPGFDYFPTAHEDKVRNHYRFDVSLYNINVFRPFPEDFDGTFGGEFLTNALQRLPSTCVNCYTGMPMHLTYYNNLDTVNFLQMTHIGKNQNVLV